MKSFIFSILLGSMFLFSNFAEARETHTRGGWYACVTDSFLTDATEYIKAGDEASYQRLLSAKVCIETEDHVRAEILRRLENENDWEIIEIRISGRSGKWFTFIEAVYWDGEGSL